MVACHLFVVPAVTQSDLRHPLELGTLRFHRVLEILGLSFRKAVAEFRVRADADQCEVAQKMEIAV